MKKIWAFLLMICMVLSLFGQILPAQATQLPESGTSAITANDQSVASGSHGLDANVMMLGAGQLVDNVESVIIYEWASKTLLYTWNADAKQYPASFVKIMTALLAIEQGNLEDIVTVREGVLDSLPADAASCDLKAGEQMPLLDLLYCLLVGSANDAALVIADHLMGSQAAFVEEMNRRAAELGCTGTQFTNAHGLHNAQQYTTARDSARILAAAMENEQFREIFETDGYTAPATNLSEERLMHTGNYMVANTSSYYDTRVKGGRTGVMNTGARCLAVSARQSGMKLICIVMGAKDTYDENDRLIKVYGGFSEMTALLDKGFNGFKTVQVLHSGQALWQHAVEKGSNDVILGTHESYDTVLPEGARLSDLRFQYADSMDGFRAPIEEGQKLSNVQIWYNNICVAQADLYAMNAVKEASDGNVIEPAPVKRPTAWPKFLIVFAVIAAVIFVGVLILRLTTAIRRMVAKKRSSRYRRSRRRSR